MGSLKKIEGGSSSSAASELEKKDVPSTKLSLAIGGSKLDLKDIWAKNKNVNFDDDVHHNTFMITDSLPSLQGVQYDLANMKPIGDVAAAGVTSVTTALAPNNNISDEDKANPFDWSRNFYPDMDPKRLKRIMSNRMSAKRSRTRRNQHVADLEKEARSLENKIAILHPQVKVYENQHRLLSIEQHQVKIRMATLEKERILKEAEMEQMKAEVNRLKALQWNMEHSQVHEMMRGWGSDMSLMANSSSPSQVNKNEEEASKVMKGGRGGGSQKNKEKGKKSLTLDI